MLFYLNLAKLMGWDLRISWSLVSSLWAYISAIQVNLEEFTQQYFCHILDIQTECNLPIKSDFFNPEKDNTDLKKFSFEVLYVIWLAIVQHNSRKWYLLIQGPDSCHTIRFPFSPYLPNEYIVFLFLTELGNLTIILYQNKLYHFFLAGIVRHATWIDTSWSGRTWEISLP